MEKILDRFLRYVAVDTQSNAGRSIMVGSSARSAATPTGTWDGKLK